MVGWLFRCLLKLRLNRNGPEFLKEIMHKYKDKFGLNLRRYNMSFFLKK